MQRVRRSPMSANDKTAIGIGGPVENRSVRSGGPLTRSRRRSSMWSGRQGYPRRRLGGGRREP